MLGHQRLRDHFTALRVQSFRQRRLSGRCATGPSGINAIKQAVLVLQFTQLGQVRDGHDRIVALPLVIRRLAYAVFAAGLANFGAQLELFEGADDLAFTEL